MLLIVLLTHWRFHCYQCGIRARSRFYISTIWVAVEVLPTLIQAEAEIVVAWNWHTQSRITAHLITILSAACEYEEKAYKQIAIS